MIDLNWSFDGDFLLYPEFKRIPDEISGIYFLYDSNKKLMYIGVAKYLRKRIIAHFNGGSANTVYHSSEFKYFSVIYEMDSELRSLFEAYFIQKYNPPLNSARNPRATCKGFKKDGSKCGSFSTINGYCRHHKQQDKSLKI